METGGTTSNCITVAGDAFCVGMRVSAKLVRCASGRATTCWWIWWGGAAISRVHKTTSSQFSSCVIDIARCTNTNGLSRMYIRPALLPIIFFSAKYYGKGIYRIHTKNDDFPHFPLRNSSYIYKPPHRSTTSHLSTAILIEFSSRICGGDFFFCILFCLDGILFCL